LRAGRRSSLRDGDPRASELVELYVNCKRFRCLPEAGGWLDQDPDICGAFEAIAQEYEVWEEEERRKAERRGD
jgi:hypothetical protein